MYRCTYKYDIKFLSCYFPFCRRVTCLGCENGHVRCSIVDCDNNSVLKNLYVEYENPVSNVQLFTLSLPKISLEQFLKTEGKFSKYFKLNQRIIWALKFWFFLLDPALLDENPEINLLVVNSLYHSEVFMLVVIHKPYLSLSSSDLIFFQIFQEYYELWFE